MKKRFNNSVMYKTWFQILLLGAMSFSCNDDFFDKQPLDQVSNATFWKTKSDAELALNGCYSVPDKRGKTDFLCAESMILLDLAGGNGVDKSQYTYVMTGGELTATNRKTRSYWVDTYERIATYNNFLDNIGNVNMDESLKARMVAEVRTMRAYSYFNLALLFGDVPLVKRVLTITEANSVTRTPRAEVWDFLEKELTESAANLPATVSDSENGRITSGAALAILGRLQMVQKKWSDAALTYKTIIDSKVYIIQPKYKELFWSIGELSEEIILATQFMEDSYPSWQLLRSYPNVYGGYHQYSPSNNLVKAYECIDGKTIDKSPLYDPNNPYDNRDPRLDYSIFISDRSMFKDKLYISRPGSGAPDDLTFINQSGYCVRKFADENYDGNLRTAGNNWILIRYAEVLLSYLESMLESGVAIDQALLDQTINLVRGRPSVNMPPVTTTDVDELREIVRRERRVELAFEGLRLFDVLRWGIAAEELNGDVTGMKLTDDPANYTDFPVDDEGYYIWMTKAFKKGVNELWPIPQSERDINKNLTQNTGY